MKVERPSSNNPREVSLGVRIRPPQAVSPGAQIFHQPREGCSATWSVRPLLEGHRRETGLTERGRLVCPLLEGHRPAAG